jgi:hypothetical protein
MESEVVSFPVMVFLSTLSIMSPACSRSTHASEGDNHHASESCAKTVLAGPDGHREAQIPRISLAVRK